MPEQSPKCAHPALKYSTSIRTDRLLIRSIEESDADGVFGIRSFKEVYIWTTAGQWPDPAAAKAWISSQFSDPLTYRFVVELLPSSSSSSDPTPTRNPLVGMLGTRGTPPNEIGYSFHPGFWKRGYASEAFSAFLPLFAETLSLEYVEAVTDEENVGSRALLSKLGFEVVERKDFEHVSLGRRVNTVMRVGKERIGCRSERQSLM
ncbi:acyl-CoA N-acyltransferase [Aulographum hederae CBS 113979]|uniref:Acyl-CoA N-acyltransferase n=1 Tax=Aulographum hederae CBS 113979 TaxID=1176131 RepID=A0A6G1HFA9_9PEZI|nr:acyl-CoA N-acyltransferase [Aulographum hederae CBS 113979]